MPRLIVRIMGRPTRTPPISLHYGIGWEDLLKLLIGVIRMNVVERCRSQNQYDKQEEKLRQKCEQEGLLQNVLLVWQNWQHPGEPAL